MTFHIGLRKPCRENNVHEFVLCHYMEPGRVKHCTWEVQKTVSFRFRHTARQALSQIRWNGYQPSHDLYIHRDEIDAEVKFRFRQHKDLKPAFYRSGCHRGRTGPRQWTETLHAIQESRERVTQRIMRTSVVQLEELLADQCYGGPMNL